jgi:hypothetical protein
MFWNKRYDFYLSGPMRGYLNLNKSMFALASHLLRSSGYTVFNPAEHDSYLNSTFKDCITMDIDRSEERRVGKECTG